MTTEPIKHPMPVVAVIDYWDDSDDGEPGTIPARYVTQVGDQYLAIYTWLPSNHDVVEEEVIGVFPDVQSAIKRLWKREHTMQHLLWPNLYGTI